MDELIKRIREKLITKDTVDDDIALDIIIDEVLADPKYINYPIEDLDPIIKSIFYKLRKRLSILDPLLHDDTVTEIMVNGKDDIFIEQDKKVKKYDLSFSNTHELEEVIRNIAGDVHREINELNPIVDCRLEDGSRVNGVYKNVAINGPILTIRKFSDNFMNMDDLVKANTINEEGRILLSNLVKTGYNIFVSGGTSAGKTSLLNALSFSIPKDERVIVIEDSMELKLSSISNIVHLEAKKGNNDGVGMVTMSDLIKTSLRMRPDRIIVGEVRGSEVIPMLQAMNTGHNGSLSTGHANSVSGMLKRLETLYLSSQAIPIDAIRLQIVEGIDIMVHIERKRNGLRKITEIVELVDYKNGEYILNPIMKLEDDELKRCSKIIKGYKAKNSKEVIDELQSFDFI